jgi:hypothetical protein
MRIFSTTMAVVKIRTGRFNMADHVRATVLKEPGHINRRLEEMGLNNEALIRAVQVARTEHGNATGLHPANAAGTFA